MNVIDENTAARGARSQRMRPLLLACAIAGMASLSCDGDAATTGDEATPAPNSTATFSPSPAQTRLEELPAVVAVVRDAFLQRDVEQLVGLTSPVSLPCVAEVTDKVKGPVCPAGVSPGTALQALPFAVCQGGWTTDFADAFGRMTERAGRLAVVAEMGKAPADWPQAYTYGDLLLVFEPRDEPKPIDAVAIYVEDGLIVRAQNGCRTVEGFVEQENPRPTVLWLAP